ncbi:hypothetical protein K3495_g14873 [Podosphaera aphanis]|nr:hypothetical protein K3495_g14873 [Podosphaera aphanis]
MVPNDRLSNKYTLKEAIPVLREAEKLNLATSQPAVNQSPKSAKFVKLERVTKDKMVEAQVDLVEEDMEVDAEESANIRIMLVGEAEDEDTEATTAG